MPFTHFSLRRPRWRSLSARLVIPIAGLMIVSLLISTLAFVVGTQRTQDQLLQQQITSDVERVRQALTTRLNTVELTADMLAHDPIVQTALQVDTAASGASLNDRALVIRERFDLDLVQIYDQMGSAKTNLVASSLYRISSLLDRIGTKSFTIENVEGKALLLAHVSLAYEAGAIITGVDLEAELNRIVADEHLPADLGLQGNGIEIGTRADLPFDLANGQNGDRYAWHVPIELGGLRFELYVVRHTADISQVTNAGLIVMIASALMTTLLLIGMAVAITRSITRPVHQLSLAAELLAKGDLSHQIEVAELAQPIANRSLDEIGVLTQTFNTMITELRGLYQDLESKVEARTRQLAAASEVARAASASLDLDVTLCTSIDLICDRFDFYHAAIFIIDPRTDKAVLREARGEIGQTLKDSQYELAIGSRSLVGTATASRQPYIIQDVAAEPLHFRNPLLNPTQAEAVIPLLYGDTLVGALDVQSKHVGSFTPDLVALLKTLADQLAVAIHNAQLYAQQRDTALRLAELDRLKTQFVTNMSHELRTPLNAVIGFSRVILKGLDGPLTDLQRIDITAIFNSSQHLLSLINNLLDYSKIEAGQLELNYDPQVDLKTLIRAALSASAGLIGDRHIGLTADLPYDLPPIEADRVRLQQIMLNLLSNAVKFTPAGQITVRAHATLGLGPRSRQIEPFVEVSVIDTGIGIAADAVEKMFEPFTQVDGSATRREGGAGLGLSITRELVELHGGRIWVESQPDKGSTFAFILPVRAPTPDRATIPQEMDYAAA